jgi:ribosomal protein L29
VSKQVEAVHLLRSFSAEDLEEHLRQQRRRLFEVRFQQAAGQVENHRQVRELRREIARTMTVQLELVRGHHLVSDLEVEEEPEEQPQPRRLSRRRPAAEPVEAPETLDTGEVEAEVAPVEPAPRSRRSRRRPEVEPVAAEAEPGAAEDADLDVAVAGPEVEPEEADPDAGEVPEGAGAEIDDEGATGPDEEQTDE